MTGQPIKLLLDEHIWDGLAKALGQRGYDFGRISQTELRSIDDEPLLAFATAEGRSTDVTNHASCPVWPSFHFDHSRNAAYKRSSGSTGRDPTCVSRLSARCCKVASSSVSASVS